MSKNNIRFDILITLLSTNKNLPMNTPSFKSYLGTFSGHIIVGIFLLGFCLISDSNIVFAKVYDPYQITSHGDQSTIQIQVSNFGSKERDFLFGPSNGNRVVEHIPAFGSQRYLLQCLKRNDVQDMPPLEFNLGGVKADFYDWVTRSEDPRKIIWNRGSLQSSNQIKWPLKKALTNIYNRPIRSVRTTSFVPLASAWSRAEIFLTSLKALSELSEEQLRILKMTVTGGSTLVIGTGDMEGDEHLLQQFISVGLGQVKATGGALLQQLPRVSSYRSLYPNLGSYPIVITDNEPIAIESQLGLGKVRVLAVRLNELTPSDISNRILKSSWEARDQLEEWLDLSMPPLTQPPRLLNDQVWLILFIIPLLFIFAKGSWQRVLGIAGLWLTIAFLRPPLFDPTSISRAHLLYIPMDEGAMVLAQVDLNSFDRGGRSEIVKSEQFSIISTETQGACYIQPVIETNEESIAGLTDRSGKMSTSKLGWWIIDSELGERQRFKYLAYVPRIPRHAEGVENEFISEWPLGPWSGAQIEPLSLIAKDLPIPADLSAVKAWRLPGNSMAEKVPPLVFNHILQAEE